MADKPGLNSRDPYKDKGTEIGSIVSEKNKAYGDSFKRAPQILAILYPEGIRVDQYADILTVVRILDKLSRIATDRDAFGENPWNDVAGYSILASIERDKQIKTDEKTEAFYENIVRLAKED